MEELTFNEVITWLYIISWVIAAIWFVAALPIMWKDESIETHLMIEYWIGPPIIISIFGGAVLYLAIALSPFIAIYFLIKRIRKH